MVSAPEYIKEEEEEKHTHIKTMILNRLFYQKFIKYLKSELFIGI